MAQTASQSSTHTSTLTGVTGTKIETPIYTWKKSVSDWFYQTWSSSYSDQQVENRMLSLLPFFPDPDATRTARIINTPVSDGKYIHELFIENTQPATDHSPAALDVVLIHGYAASLGLFLENFDSLSSIPGVRIHAIDLPGFGFSSRTNFPHLGVSKEDVYKTEDWFIDAVEEWRVKRGISRFILMGHSFGGYLSSAYTLKYNKPVADDSGTSHNLIDKLVLISPCGFERNKYSVLKDSNTAGSAISREERENQNKHSAEDLVNDEQINELLANQEEIVQAEVDHETPAMELRVETAMKRRSVKLVRSLWERHYSLFSFVRNAGMLKSKWISNWTTRRFAHIYNRNPDHFQYIHDYIYRIFNAKGSGEFAITRVYAFAALARLPLIDRCPEKFVSMNLPTLLMYGDEDWMDAASGLQMQKEINDLSQKKYGHDLASYAITPKAGHHLYLDNPVAFFKEVLGFISS